ncbi:sigma-54-dependent Fis family transcriptional regulator [bacterium]|nr:sigma-54-dependent Fis family transcriptional regulator [bacterium]
MKIEYRILVVDDNASTLEIIQRNLTSGGYKVYISSNAMDAISFLNNEKVDLVITDYKMPKVNGLELTRYIRENYHDTEVMMITGYPSVPGAVNAIKGGAEEYLAKPFTSEELIQTVNKVIEKLEVIRSNRASFNSSSFEQYGMLGNSNAIKKVYREIEKSNRTVATVLINGESGTGKELIARAIHYGSKRSSSPFVPINCGAIPETLLESELFGHVKGAFTGADVSRAGFFLTADGGTVFLDEISDTSPAMQARLLRFLQEKEVCMVGDSKTRKVDVRVIAASNKDLLSLVKKGIFREDLYYRLNVISISVPPLREREGDIAILANHFLKKSSQEMDCEIHEISEEALKILVNYSWPGNIREFENLILRLVVMKEDIQISVADLPSHMKQSLKVQQNLHRTLEAVEKEYIQNVLNHVDGNKTKAAGILGISRKTLRTKLLSPE